MNEMARRIVRRARPPRYIWQNPPMAERRLAIWLLMFHLGIMMFTVGVSEARILASVGAAEPTTAATSPEEASAMLELRMSLSLRDDQEWPELSDPCATWNGVRCEEGHVVEVRLSGLAAATLGKQQRQQQQRPTSTSIDALQQLPLLRLLNASGFSLVGSSLPVWIGGLLSLEVMDFMSASLTGSIPTSIGQLSNLKILRLANNSLTGPIPSSIGNLKSLVLLDLSSNELQGRIPDSLGGLQELKVLNLSLNRLQGTVPDRPVGLRRLLLARNNLRGPIPPQLGSLVNLTHLDLSANSLTGSIPADLGQLAYLTVLNLARNELAGDIPAELFNCSQLQVLLLGLNALTGALPPSLGKLQSMMTLDLSSNSLSGRLPAELSNLTQVESMVLSDNLLCGSVPAAISLLQKLAVLDLSGNYFSGALPRLLPKTHLSDARVLIMDRNCFSLPYLMDQRLPSDCSNAYPNNKNSKQRLLLMAELLSSPSTPSSSSSSGNHSHLVAILAGVFAMIAVIFLVAILVFYVLQFERKAEARRRAKRAAAIQRYVGNKAARKALNIPSGRSINVARLGEAFPYVLLQNATGLFDLANMIMAGHSGDLYKGILSGTTAVVVKRIDVGRFKKDLYVSELEFFGRVSHARLVPLLGHCLEMEDEKLLVYKYMPNGDLAYALHRKESPSRPEDVLQSLDWITRLKIAIGVAEGLVYLHHECSPPLVHRDIKASSILLDDKFEVRLGSLNEARVQQGEHPSSIIGRFLRLSRSSDQLDAGLPLASCSYDVFCFGKVLLELVSGKLGISGSIDPGADAWLDWALPLIDIHDREPLLKLMDPSLIVDEDLMEEVWATAIIAKSCLNPKASRRPNMKHILRALENPQKVVRDDHSGPMKSRHSSYGSWNSALFGGWRHFSSDSAFGLREEHSFELNNNGRGAQTTGSGEEPRYHRRPGSREIVPVPLSTQTAPTHESDGAES